MPAETHTYKQISLFFNHLLGLSVHTSKLAFHHKIIAYIKFNQDSSILFCAYAPATQENWSMEVPSYTNSHINLSLQRQFSFPQAALNTRNPQ